MGSPIPKKKSTQPAKEAKSSPAPEGAAIASRKGFTIAGIPLFLQRQSNAQNTTKLDPAVQPQAAALKKKITDKLDAIIEQVNAIDSRVKTATKDPKKLGQITFPGKLEKGKPTTRSLKTMMETTVEHHNEKATKAIKAVLKGKKIDESKYHITYDEAIAALRASNTYSKKEWNEWAGSKTGMWDEKWPLSEIWAEATDKMPVKKYKGIWQDAYWFVDGKTRKDLEKVGFNLTLEKDDKSTLVMGFDPKSNESKNKVNPKDSKKPLPQEPMDLDDKTKLAKGTHRGYPFTTKQGHLGIVWVSGAEIFVESLIKINGKRIKISGSFWGSGRWQYDE